MLMSILMIILMVVVELVILVALAVIVLLIKERIVRFWRKIPMEEQTDYWYNPDPQTIGSVELEIPSSSMQYKAVVVHSRDGNYHLFIYSLDDSDVKYGYKSGWVSISGPSITDSIENAKKLAIEYLRNYQ